MNIKLPAVAIIFLAMTVTLPVTADTLPPITRHFGMCDASAAVPVAPDLFVVANDEDNTLRIFQKNKSGEALYSQDISAFLQIDPKHPEADIEGATLIKNRIYWITSHGSNKDGKKRPNRHRFFATEIETIDGQFNLKPIGKPFAGLVKAFEDFAGLKEYHLGKAAKHEPESKHGLNIEGLTKTPQGHLLIGFRNPVPQGKALLVLLENPQAVIAGHEKPKLGNPILLALNGLGIRSIEYSDTKGAYFIIAGPYDDNGRFQLFQWSGNPSAAPELVKMDFHKLHPEGLVVYPQQKAKIQIISDDGSALINNQNCKGLTNAQDKSFRSFLMDPRLD